MIMMTSGIIGNECKIRKSLYIILMRDKTALYINCTKSVYEFKLRVLKKEYTLFQYFSYTYKTYMRSSTKNNIIANLGVQTMNDLLRHSSRLTHTHSFFNSYANTNIDIFFHCQQWKFQLAWIPMFKFLQIFR